MILLITCILLLLGTFFYLNHKADDVLFHPVRRLLTLTLPWEQFFLPVEKGEKIHAAWLAPKPGKPVILFFHGRGGNISHFEIFATRYAKHGFGILLFDYRGFGQSSGRPGQAHARQDGLCALDYLLNHKHIPAENIVIWGYSMGNAPALAVAAAQNTLPLKAVILQSPFTNAPALGAYWACRARSLRQHFLRGALNLILCNKRMDNLPPIRQVTAPLLVGFSKQDEMIPWQMSMELAQHAPQSKKIYCSEAGTHAEFAWFEQAALDFLNKLDAASVQ